MIWEKSGQDIYVSKMYMTLEDLTASLQSGRDVLLETGN